MKLIKLQQTDQSDFKQCYQLWQDCFGDSPKYMDYYFGKKTVDNQIYALKDQEDVVSMLHLNPYQMSLNNEKHLLHYIVGVATKKEARSKGYMRKVLTHAMKKMRDAGEIATYLMPAAKEIYLPYDFRYIYSQDRISAKLTKSFEKRAEVICFKELSNEKKQQVVAFANERLQQEFSIYTIHTEAYFERLVYEMQAAGGNVVAVYEQEELIAVISYMLEHGSLEIVETIGAKEKTEEIVSSFLAYAFESSKEEQVNATWLETHFLNYGHLKEMMKPYGVKEQEQPIIMARILNAKEALEQMSLVGEEAVHINVKVEDSFISENCKTFCIDATKNGTTVTETNEAPDVTMDIAELTQFFFHSRLNDADTLRIMEIRGSETEQSLARLMGCPSAYINEIV